MKFTIKFLLALSLIASAGFASMESMADKIASLNIGMDSYIIGKELTQDQKETAKNNNIPKAVSGTYKFKDGTTFVVASKDGDKVLVLYKSYESVDNKKIRTLFGGAMIDFGDPTAMAHDKLVYWSYDSQGKKLSEEDLQAFKDKIAGEPKGGTLAETLKKEPAANKFEPYVSVKLSCSKEIMTKEIVYDDATAYLLMSSSKLIEEMQKQMSKK